MREEQFCKIIQKYRKSVLFECYDLPKGYKIINYRAVGKVFVDLASMGTNRYVVITFVGVCRTNPYYFWTWTKDSITFEKVVWGKPHHDMNSQQWITKILNFVIKQAPSFSERYGLR